jgi:nitrogen regulatory protein PII
MMDDAWQLTAMTKIEVVVGGEESKAVAELFAEVGATGFTAVSNVSGLGHDGYHKGRLLFNDRNGLALLMVVLPADRVPALLAGLRPLLARRPGVLLVSETRVSRPEYFQ